MDGRDLNINNTVVVIHILHTVYNNSKATIALLFALYNTIIQYYNLHKMNTKLMIKSKCVERF